MSRSSTFTSHRTAHAPRGTPISQLAHHAQRRTPGERSRPRHARSGFFFANDALLARRRHRSTAPAPVNRVRRESYVTSRPRMMPAHSGGFDGTNVFNHPQNHPNGHPRRHAHRISASAALFNCDLSTPFFRVCRSPRRPENNVICRVITIRNLFTNFFNFFS